MTEELKQKIIDYYTIYYRDDCSLPDWMRHVEGRLGEESLEEGRMRKLESNFKFDIAEKKHCIVGAGSGGLAAALKQHFYADVYGVEPDPDACELINMRCQEYGIPDDHFLQGYGENLPFEDESFDFVHCFTVLEHVEDIERCIDEMLRVVKRDGRIIINTPNYAFPQERHYKIFFPTFLPKFLGKIYLLLRGKRTNFFNTINLVTERNINLLLIKKRGIRWFRVYSSHGGKSTRSLGERLSQYLIVKKFKYPQQDIILYKAID